MVRVESRSINLKKRNGLLFERFNNQNMLASTFYENRYGFKNNELKGSILNSDSFDSYPLNFNYNRISNNSPYYQQIRQFKTKRQLNENREENILDMLRGNHTIMIDNLL